MSKRTVLAILALITYAAATAFAQQNRPWSSVFMPPYGTMHDVAAQDRYHFWAVGDNGNILATTDGGTIWSALTNAVATTQLNAVAYDISTGVVAVGAGGAYVQFLPGEDPQSQTFDAEMNFTGVDAENQIVIVVGVDAESKGVVLRSVDGGGEYAAASVTFPAGPVAINGVKFLSTEDVVIYGSTGNDDTGIRPFFITSNNAGRTWNAPVTDTRSMSVTAVARVSGDWIAVGIQDSEQGAGIFRSRDHGATWVFEEQADMVLMTDIVSPGAMDVFAIGMRVVEDPLEPRVVVSEYRSQDGGRNWGVVDVAEEGVVARMAIGGDRVIAVGFAQHSYRRWYDWNRGNTGIIVEKKHFELGSIQAGVRSDVTFFDVLRNIGPTEKTIRTIKVHGIDGVTVESPKNGDEIPAGEDVSIKFIHERQEEGMSWGVLTIHFDDNTSVAMYVSSFTAPSQPEYSLRLQNNVLDFGNIVTTEMVTQQFEVVRNDGFTPIQITGVDMEEGDLVAYGLADLPEFPVTLGSGESFSLNVMFQPHRKGTFHTLLRINTNGDPIRVPVIAACREDAIDDVIDFGTVPVGEQSEADLFYSHLLDNNTYEVQTVLGVAEPFAVTSTTPLPVELNPYDRFTVSISVISQSSGIVASIVTVPYDIGFGSVMRYDRKIVVAKIGEGDPTSVNEPIVIDEPVNIYPQPASSYATVALPPNVAWSTLSLVDVQGRVLYTGDVPTGITTMDLNVSDLQPGLYSVMLRSANGVAMSPLMKN